MTSPLLESRRELRKCAFQALMSLEFDTDVETACRFAYTHDREDTDVQLPAFLTELVSGVQTKKEELDKQITQHLKAGWTIERLTSWRETSFAWESLKSLHLTLHSWLLLTKLSSLQRTSQIKNLPVLSMDCSASL